MGGGVYGLTKGREKYRTHTSLGGEKKKSNLWKGGRIKRPAKKKRENTYRMIAWAQQQHVEAVRQKVGAIAGSLLGSALSNERKLSPRGAASSHLPQSSFLRGEKRSSRRRGGECFFAERNFPE